MADSVHAPTLRADARRNRARILEVAREVFASEGLAVPIDTVAARAGVGVGTVYRHFPTEEALFVAIVVDHVQALADEARAAADDPGEAFYGFLRLMAERSATDMALADAFTEAGVDIKSSLGVCKHDLTVSIDDLLRAQQRCRRMPTSRSPTCALLASTCLACGRQGRDAASGSSASCSTASVRARRHAEDGVGLALTMATTSVPSARPRSRAASIVIDATRRTPPASSSTLAVASPWVMPVTRAGIWLRALGSSRRVVRRSPGRERGVHGSMHAGTPTLARALVKS